MDENKSERRQRLAAALRANLQRRKKQQARRRASGENECFDKAEKPDGARRGSKPPSGKG